MCPLSLQPTAATHLTFLTNLNSLQRRYLRWCLEVDDLLVCRWWGVRGRGGRETVPQLLMFFSSFSAGGFRTYSYTYGGGKLSSSSPFLFSLSLIYFARGNERGKGETTTATTKSTTRFRFIGQSTSSVLAIAYDWVYHLLFFIRVQTSPLLLSHLRSYSIPLILKTEH